MSSIQIGELLYYLHSTVCVADINECALGHDSCMDGQSCENTEGSYLCRRLISCGTGYTLSSESQQCVGMYCPVHHGIILSIRSIIYAQTGSMPMLYCNLQRYEHCSFCHAYPTYLLDLISYYFRTFLCCFDLGSFSLILVDETAF